MSGSSASLGLSGSAEAYNALVTGLERGVFYQYVNVAALTIFVVEYIATFDFEVKYMWPPKLNLVTILFFLTRYLPIADMTVTLYTEHTTTMTQPLCSVLARTYVWLIYVGMAAAEGLLTLRVWALYGQGKKLTVFLAAVYGGSFVASAVKIYLSLKSLQVTIVSIPGLPNMCLATSYDQQLYLYWVFMIIVDAVSCILLLVQLVSAYQTGGLTNLMRVVYRDGVIFYIVLLCFSVVNIFAIIMLPADISSLLTAPERIMHAVLASRVILQTRHQVYSDKHSMITLHTIPSFDAARPEQFSHGGSAAVSFTGNYTAPAVTSPSPVFFSVSVNVPPPMPISGSGSLVSPLSLSARPLSVSTSPICAHQGPVPISPTSPISPLSPTSRASRSMSALSGSPRSSGSSGSRYSRASAVINEVERGQEAREEQGSPGPIFEAAMEKQRQRQYARIRRSFRTAQRYANAASTAAAAAASASTAARESPESQCYHLPSQRLTRSPYPVVDDNQGECEPGESGSEVR